MTSSAPSRRRINFAASDFDLDRLARPALVVAVVVSGVLIYHLTRGSSFSIDDWIWIDTRRANTLQTFLAPYNGHLSLVPIAIYRLMFALVGIGDFAPYRVLMVLVASATGLVIFEYARHRVGEFCALLAAVLLLFIGPGWNDIMQPFQIAWLIAIAGAILALSLLDRRRTPADAAACLLILISLSSTSVGVALAVGIAIDLALIRRRWRDAWIVGVPLVLYVFWALHYHPSQIEFSSITTAPLHLAQTTAAALAGDVGLSGVTATDLTGLGLTFGVPLLVLAIVAVIARAAMGWYWTRFLALAAALVTFSLLTTLARSFQSPFESRYMYVTCVLTVLMAVEVARSVSLPLRAQLALAVLTLVAVVSNIGVLRSGGGYLRQLGSLGDATMGAVELDRGTVASGTLVALYPLGAITVKRYFAAEHALGTPAYTVGQLQRTNPTAQGAADAQSIVDGDVELGGAPAPSSPGAGAPTPEAAANGVAAQRGGCVDFTPAAALAPGQANTLVLGLRPGRVSVSAGTSPTTVSVRRFAPAFRTLGLVGAGDSTVVSVAGGRALAPWHLQVQSVAPVRVCTLSGS